jgi:hypothetical protein
VHFRDELHRRAACEQGAALDEDFIGNGKPLEPATAPADYFGTDLFFETDIYAAAAKVAGQSSYDRLL